MGEMNFYDELLNEEMNFISVCCKSPTVNIFTGCQSPDPSMLTSDTKAHPIVPASIISLQVPATDFTLYSIY